MITALIGGLIAGLTLGVVLMVAGWLLEHTATGARIDRFVQRLLEAGL